MQPIIEVTLRLVLLVCMLGGVVLATIFAALVLSEIGRTRMRTSQSVRSGGADSSRYAAGR